jgi:hypothetical protein
VGAVCIHRCCARLAHRNLVGSARCTAVSFNLPLERTAFGVRSLSR